LPTTAAPCTFLIGDGVLPGNEGRNYVLRMVLRRAARFGKLIGFDGPFLAKVCRQGDRPNGRPLHRSWSAKRDFILQTITDEEERFQRTLNIGLALLDDLIEDLRASRASNVIPGDDAFRLWDTYGFPLDLTRDVAVDQGFTRR
jgi:alanyl-tRNA synthetase